MQTLIKPGQLIPDIGFNDAAIPINTMVGTAAYRASDYSKTGPKTWQRMDPYFLIANPMYLGGRRNEIEIPMPSADVWLWRIRDTALAAAERSGVSDRTVNEMCVQFGAAAPLLYVGGTVSNKHDMRSLPDGSTLYFGHPDDPKSVNVYEWAEGDLHHLLGVYTHRPEGTSMTIRSMPGTQVPEPDLTPTTQEQWARLSLRAWRVGKTYQDRHGWCGVFQNCLTSLGINDESVAKAGTVRGPGNEISGDVAIASIPEGSLLFHRFRNSDAIALYLRDDSARNLARTRRVWGHGDTGRNSHSTMTIASTPDEPDLVAMGVTGTELQTMPAGTVYRRSGYSTTYTLGRDADPVTYLHYSVVSIPIEGLSA